MGTYISGEIPMSRLIVTSGAQAGSRSGSLIISGPTKSEYKI